MTSARFSYDGLNRVIHEKARLGILTSLITHKNGLSFGDLKRLCDLTDGNLSRHIKVLSEAEFVSVTKSFQDNRPHTHCQITPSGHAAYAEYIEVLESIVKNAAQVSNFDITSPKKS